MRISFIISSYRTAIIVIFGKKVKLKAGALSSGIEVKTYRISVGHCMKTVAAPRY
jgi:hypothetical protein